MSILLDCHQILKSESHILRFHSGEDVAEESSFRY